MENQDECTGDKRIRFVNNLLKLATTTIEEIEKKEKFMKIKTNLRQEYLIGKKRYIYSG